VANRVNSTRQSANNCKTRSNQIASYHFCYVYTVTGGHPGTNHRYCQFILGFQASPNKQKRGRVINIKQIAWIIGIPACYKSGAHFRKYVHIPLDFIPIRLVERDGVRNPHAYGRFGPDLVYSGCQNRFRVSKCGDQFRYCNWSQKWSAFQSEPPIKVFHGSAISPRQKNR